MFGFGNSARRREEFDAQRFKREARALNALFRPKAAASATYPLSDPLAYEKLYGPQSFRLSPERAMAHSAFYRCIFLIAGSIAMLDFNTWRLGEDGHREQDVTSPAARLIAVRPNGRMSPSMFWRDMVANMLTQGNGVAWIERKPSGEPSALHPIPWTRTGVRLEKIDGDFVQIYTLTLDDGRYVVAHQSDVLHIPGSAVWQIFCAMSPLTAYAMAVGIGLSADAFAKAYFDNGSSPDGYIKYPNGLKKGGAQADEIRTYWTRKWGGANRFNGPAVLDEGGEFVPLPMNASDAQLLDSRKFSVSDIANVFGVPVHMLNQTEKATSFGKGLEEMTQSFLDFTLGPHLKAIEDEINYKLVRQSTKVAEFDREGFVRGDLKSRMEAIQIALGGAQGPGTMTQNEGRKKLNLGPSKEPGADKLVSWPPAPKNPAGDAASTPEPNPAPASKAPRKKGRSE
jgi:HK97 family phage portal protein